MHAISVSGLTKEFRSVERGSSFGAVVKSLFAPTYRTTTAVNNISFSVDEGELVGFLGPNGAGKSTTLKILTGILHPTAGEAQVMGFTPWKERRKFVGRIGAVFGQKSQLLWDIPPHDAFLLSKAVYEIPKKEFDYRLEKLTTLLDVASFIHSPTRSLSLGERMKCEFIMAMLHGPKIVFLDEPTIGLDIISKERIREFIREMNNEGTTFILTTHDLEDVEALARRVIVVNHGELAFDGSQEQLRGKVGRRKRIMVSTERPLGELAEVGATVIARLSPLETEIELDTTVTPLLGFISALDAAAGVRDITVQEIPIEAVIKELYQK